MGSRGLLRYFFCAAAAMITAAASNAADASTPADAAVVDGDNANRRTTQARLDAPEIVHMPCSEYAPFVDGCHVRDRCQRHIIDDFAAGEVLEALRAIATKGMATSPLHGGPTIFDVNSGYMRDGYGPLINVYEEHRGQPPVEFTPRQFELYGGVFDKIKQAIMDTFGLETLYFTAPTFVTRIVGNEKWNPQNIHDEYWHQHVDKNNTANYDYSGLLYLSDYGTDFTGGTVVFEDAATGANHTVEPRRGRFLMFTSGVESPHTVMRVETGVRYVMSMWFTCDKRYEFKKFLDGKVHKKYHGGGDAAAEEARPADARRTGEGADTATGGGGGGGMGLLTTGASAACVLLGVAFLVNKLLKMRGKGKGNGKGGTKKARAGKGKSSKKKGKRKKS